MFFGRQLDPFGYPSHRYEHCHPNSEPKEPAHPCTHGGARGMPSMIDYTTASVKIIVFFISMQMNYFSRKPFVLNAICLHYGANPLQGRFCAEID